MNHIKQCMNEFTVNVCYTVTVQTFPVCGIGDQVFHFLGHSILTDFGYFCWEKAACLCASCHFSKVCTASAQSPSAFLLGLYKNVHPRIETQTSGSSKVPTALLVDCSLILTKVLRAFFQAFPPYKVSFQSCVSKCYIEEYLKWEKFTWDYWPGIIEIEH
jgi:hypothetical protein